MKNVYLSFVYLFNRDLVAELPFILMHPKPEEEDPLPIMSERSPNKNDSKNRQGSSKEKDNEVPTTNLIQLDE